MLKTIHTARRRPGITTALGLRTHSPARVHGPAGSRAPAWALLAALVFCLALVGPAAGPLQAAPAAPDAGRPLEGASILFSPSPAIIQACETVAVEVRVNDVFDLYGVDIKVAFDPGVLEVVDANPAKPGIQVQDGGFLSPDFVVSREADNAAGTLEYAMTQVGGSPVSGSGVLCTIFFQAKSTAEDTALTFTQTDLVDLDGLLIWPKVVQGSASTVAPAVPVLGILKLNATDVRLSWSAAAGVLGYVLHRKAAPYFVPVAPPYQATSALSYDDLGALGNVAENHYYVVESVCASGFTSQPSKRVGEFDFRLVPGGF